MVKVSSLVLPVIGGILGAFLPAEVVTGPAKTLLPTFLGLIAASILPTIGLLIASIDSKSRSVKSVQNLIGEIKYLTKNLLYILLIVIMTIVMLVALNSPGPEIIMSRLESDYWPVLLGQIFLFALIGLAIDRTIVVPKSIFRCINFRAATATGEAKERTSKNAPKPADVKAGFKKKNNFGVVRNHKK